MKKCVFITCDNNYVPKAIVALNQFKYNNNKDFEKAIIGTKFDGKMKKIAMKYNVKLFEINLKNDFIDLEKRPYGKNYPIECFYHFYAYKLLNTFDYIVLIEPDIFTNKKIYIDFNSVNYIGGSYNPNNLINNYDVIMRDYSKIKNIFDNSDINQYRILGGVKVYNVKNLQTINFYETIVNYYKKSIEIGAPRCGDDSLMVMYQLLNKNHVTLLNPEFHVIRYKNNYTKAYYNSITFFHFGGRTQKYWKIDIKNKNLNPLVRYFYNKLIFYIKKYYNKNFISKYISKNI